MRRMIFLIASVVFAFVFIGCSKTETTNNSNATSTTTTEKPAPPKTETASTTSTGDKIGVPECDDFIAKYESCVTGKVPEMARVQYENMLKTWKTEWKKAADNPQTRETLAAACKQMAAQQTAALKSFGCSF